MMDEIGNPGIPLSVISKAAEIQLLYAVVKVLLGNRWLRKSIGVQPKFPYMVDSFEKRSAASFLRANMSCGFISDSGFRDDVNQSRGISEVERKDNFCDKQGWMLDFRFPSGDWSGHPWLKQQQRKVNSTSEHRRQAAQSSPFLPKITMVGVSIGEAVQLSEATLKKTILNVTKELEQVEQGNSADSASDQFNLEDRDPLRGKYW